MFPTYVDELCVYFFVWLIYMRWCMPTWNSVWFFKIGANQLKTVKYAANVKPQPTRNTFYCTFYYFITLITIFGSHYNPWQPSMLLMLLFLCSQTLHEAMVPVYQGMSSSRLFLTPLMNWVRAKQSFHWDHTFNQLLPLERQTVVSGSLIFVILLRQTGNTFKVSSPQLAGSLQLSRLVQVGQQVSLTELIVVKSNISSK